MLSSSRRSLVVDETILEVDRLTKAFGGLMAISDLSFAVKKGQIKAIIGPNGAGKTTCLNVIVAFIAPLLERSSFAVNQ